MRTLVQLIGYISIVVLILPSILFLCGGIRMGLDQVKTVMLVATIVWFGANIILVWNLDKKLMGKSN